MYKYILQSFENINILAMLALITFFTVFGTAVFLLFVRSKQHFDHMASLPMTDDADPIDLA